MTARTGFTETLARFGPGTPVVLCHDDADGLSAGALFARALAQTSHGPAQVRVIGRGESAWSDAIRAELTSGPPVAGLIVTDLGVQAEPVLTGIPTVIVDHHVPRSLPAPEVAAVISGLNEDPIPTSSLLAHRCAAVLLDKAGADALIWLAALGAVGDLGERGAPARFPEVMAGARRFGTLKSLREAVSLINAPRRASRGDASPALRLLLRADGLDAVVSDASPDGEALRQARAEVKEALDDSRKVPPLFAGPVALIRCDSPCQIHPLVAQSWTHRLRRQAVIGANAGFREGFVHFAARSATVPDLIAFLQDRAPPLGPDDQFAQGHRRATGGQVTRETWNHFAAELGFGSEAMV
ncbi:DHH family phosphoesterase [Methylobacterium nonmethylotrophicum]|uniref:DHH family phosphoesterase n=1 Tax=Methylobacterium nonmethylotrophicum TaxID=1141884 RepID=A0A4Z0NFC4_9HYPH|nr:DHH family phosphoesterase [Methylobacterium nonmethylotrophicum]TGD94930.1 DHH family phosphoesterase [Methylobacterium nonmethylotrophicum]